VFVYPTRVERASDERGAVHGVVRRARGGVEECACVRAYVKTLARELSIGEAETRRGAANT